MIFQTDIYPYTRSFNDHKTINREL